MAVVAVMAVMVDVLMARMVVGIGIKAIPKEVWVHIEIALPPDAIVLKVHPKELVFGRHRIQPTMTS